MHDGVPAIATMEETGRLLEVGELFVPQMQIAALAVKGCLHLLRPALVALDVRPGDRVVIGKVARDLHAIGKSRLAMMLEVAGFEVMDMSVETPQKSPEAGVEACPDIIALSALLTTTVEQIA